MKIKLLTKNIIYNTIISIIVLFVGELSVFMLLEYEINKEVVEHLYGERMAVLNKLEHGVDLQLLEHNIGDKLTIKKISSPAYLTPRIKEVEIEEIEEEHKSFQEERFSSKQIIFDAKYKDSYYRFVIEKTIDEDEGVGGNMFLIILISGLFMLLLLFAVNFLVYKRLLKPFYKTLKELRGFKLSERKTLELSETSTYEFSELNKALEFVSKKTIEDYILLKEFTENTSHELQTPLSIINNKIELCMQEGDLNQKQARSLSDALNALERLSQINQGLIMLTKLENDLYEKTEELTISEMLIDRLDFFSDFIENKNLELTVEKTSDVFYKMNRSLCNTLFDNIIKNAIKYNFQNGKLIIQIEKNTIKIVNSGLRPENPTSTYFGRFYKSGDPDSLGLGLAISKKICDLYKINIEYRYENELHSIILIF